MLHLISKVPGSHNQRTSFPYNDRVVKLRAGQRVDQQTNIAGGAARLGRCHADSEHVHRRRLLQLFH